MKLKLVLAAVVIASSFTSVIAAAGGDFEGNGGDRCARDFTRLGRIVYDVIQGNEYYRQNIDMVRLNDAINKASVSIVTGQLSDAQGGVVVAANDGVSKIFLSKALWCDKSIYQQEVDIVLHEYLGIAMPGRDQQYQLSAALYSRVGLSNENFHNFSRTGTDYETETVYFNFKTAITADSIVLETKSIKEFFNVIYIDEAYRHEKRAKVFCKKGQERLELYSLYAAYANNKNPKWFYQETPLQVYRFTSSQQCYRLQRKAATGKDGTQVELGMDTLTVVNFL